MGVRLATESQSAYTFVMPVPAESSFNKVGTLLATMCWLLLEAPECRVLGSGDRRVVLLLEIHLFGRKVDRSVLATDMDAGLGLITCVWDRIGQMARRSIPERSSTGVNVIPVSGVGEAVGGVSEAVGDGKMGGNGVEGTLNKDMTNDEMTF